MTAARQLAAAAAEGPGEKMVGAGMARGAEKPGAAEEEEEVASGVPLVRCFR